MRFAIAIVWVALAYVCSVDAAEINPFNSMFNNWLSQALPRAYKNGVVPRLTAGELKKIGNISFRIIQMGLDDLGPCTRPSLVAYTQKLRESEYRITICAGAARYSGELAAFETLGYLQSYGNFFNISLLAVTAGGPGIYALDYYAKVGANASAASVYGKDIAEPCAPYLLVYLYQVKQLNTDCPSELPQEIKDAAIEWWLSEPHYIQLHETYFSQRQEPNEKRGHPTRSDVAADFETFESWGRENALAFALIHEIAHILNGDVKYGSVEDKGTTQGDDEELLADQKAVAISFRELPTGSTRLKPGAISTPIILYLTMTAARSGDRPMRFELFVRRFERQRELMQDVRAGGEGLPDQRGRMQSFPDPTVLQRLNLEQNLFKRPLD